MSNGFGMGGSNNAPERFDQRLRHWHGGPGLHRREHRLPNTFLRPWHTGRLATAQSDSDRRALSGDARAASPFSPMASTSSVEFTYTGLTTPAVLGTTSVPGSKFNGSFNDLAIGSAGIAATFAGFTVGGNVVGGQMNGQLGLQPKGGAPLLGFLAGVKYVSRGRSRSASSARNTGSRATVHSQPASPSWKRARSQHRRRKLHRCAQASRCLPNTSGWTRPQSGAQLPDRGDRCRCSGAAARRKR